MSKKNGALAFVLGVVGVGGIVLLSRKAGASSGDGGSKGDGGGHLPDEKPRPGPGGRGRIYGDINVDDIPADWNPTSNQVRISQDCKVVLEGAFFWPSTKFISAIVPGSADAPTYPKTLHGALAIKGNSVLGFVDLLIDDQGYTSAEEIGARILAELAYECSQQPLSTWGPGLRAWYGELLAKLKIYVAEATNQINPEDLQ